jgi:hypothetical protein
VSMRVPGIERVFAVECSYGHERLALATLCVIVAGPFNPSASERQLTVRAYESGLSFFERPLLVVVPTDRRRWSRRLGVVAGAEVWRRTLEDN